MERLPGVPLAGFGDPTVLFIAALFVVSILTVTGPNRQAHAVLQAWSANANTAFFVIPVAAALVGPVGATAAKKLCAPKFAALTRLALKGCKLTDAAVAALVGAPAVRNLIQLDLSDNGLKAGPNELGDPAVLPFLAAMGCKARNAGSDKCPGRLVSSICNNNNECSYYY